MEQIIFYMAIHDFSVETFLKDLELARKENPEKIQVRLSTSGGSVHAGWGMVSGFRDFVDSFTGDVIVKVDGLAASWGAIFLLFAENVEALKQSKIMLHRAAFPSWIEMTEERLEELKGYNKDMKEAFVKRINIPKFEKLAGVTVNRFFDSEKERIDLHLTAKQAKSIGLIKNVINLNPVEIGALNESLIAASSDPIEIEQEPEEEPINKDPETKKTMSPSEFATQHPEAYNTIVAEQREAADKAAKIRVDAWMKFYEVDPEAVGAGIKSGEEITMADMAGFNATALKNGYVEKVKEDSPAATKKSDDPAKDDPKEEGLVTTEDDKAKAEFNGLVQKQLGINKEENTEK